MSKLETIEYRDGDTPLTGLYALPDGKPRAAITVYPTFMNSTPAVEAKALRLVEAGYAVMIADFFGPGAPSNVDEAFTALGNLTSDPAAMRERFRASLATTKSLAPDVPQLAIGFCLGGKAVLEMARDGQDLVAVASFHGLLETANPASDPIKARVLVCHGDADPMVPRTHVMAFWEEMDAVKADWHFHSYSGVDHGFTSPKGFDGQPNPAYNASADRQSWRSMMDLFDEALD
ncbi:MAG: dienelactone hydrolase family protein [Erythrobacter sp.]|nr:dienelactone hydrolase family protein [Erythrobacter sp.]